jgi:subtilase family serine protease
MRAVPDVSLSAAVHDGYLICMNGNWYVIGGTSASSPSFAGIMAVVLQKLSGAGQGNANPILYGLLSASANPFHATPSGNNSVPGVNGFTASGASYNLATGLGSVDASVLASVWPGAVVSPAPKKGFTITPSGTSFTLMSGSSTSFAVVVAGAGGFSDLVAIKATGAAGVSLSVSPASAKPGSSVTVKVTATSTAAARVSQILLTGTSDGMTATASVALTVKAPPTLGITASTGSVTVTQGKTAKLSITVNTGGLFTGPVTLAVSGLPAGVSASWSSSSLSATGTSTTSATLTLKSTGDAALRAAAATITAAGDGLQAQTAVNVTVAKPTVVGAR